MDRIILHSDLNNYYASVECLLNPQYANRPVAVSGNPEKRHGIVLAKNIIAKKMGVKTGDTLWQAKQKCRDIVFLPPHYNKYIEISKQIREIYYEYTSQIESFGIDECWLDVTHSINLFKDGYTIAQNISNKIKKEIGLTVSIGVSFNKIFAKLGSDMKKPDAITVIDKDNFKTKIWNLNISELLYSGRSTTRKLDKLNIHTIGQLANADTDIIKYHLGKNGILLQKYAQGLDDSEVREYNSQRDIKSIGNGTTMPYDLDNIEDIKVILMLLSESVSFRMREKGLYTNCIQIDIRKSDLSHYSRQATINYKTNSTDDIFRLALKLFVENVSMGYSVRSLSVRACKLSQNRETAQLSLLNNNDNVIKGVALGNMCDKIRSKYGWSSVQKGIMLTNTDLALINPKNDNSLQTIAFFKG